jgi:hypothetical protein
MNTESTKTLVPFGKQGVQLASLEDAFRFATAVSKSGFAPKGVETPEAILIAVQFGAELGLTPMASLQSLAIINGRPSIYGDAALALVRGSGFLEKYEQKLVGEGENQKAVVTVKRTNEPEIVSEFSVADAKRAQLWGKAGPWSQYPGRMLMWRARGFALRDAFGDVLRGLATVEENADLDPVGTIKIMKPVFEKKEKAVKELPPATQPQPNHEDAPLPSGESKTKRDDVSDTTKPTDRQSVDQVPSSTPDAAKLQRLLDEAGVTIPDLVPILHSNRLCARNAASVDDLSDNNVVKIISDWDVIIAAYRAEKE